MALVWSIWKQLALMVPPCAGQITIMAIGTACCPAAQASIVSRRRSNGVMASSMQGPLASGRVSVQHLAVQTAHETLLGML